MPLALVHFRCGVHYGRKNVDTATISEYWPQPFLIVSGSRNFSNKTLDDDDDYFFYLSLVKVGKKRFREIYLCMQCI